MKQLFTLILITIVCLTATAQNKDTAAIRAILTAQTTQWNNGNLDAFMKGYWQNDSLLFIGSKGPKYGYATTLDNYKKGYPDTAHMGKLLFDIVSIKQLSPSYCFVVGKWHLQRSVGDAGGMFTLLFRKIKGQWVIVVDHSS